MAGGIARQETREMREIKKSDNIPTATTKPPNNPMHNRNILALNIIHHNLSNFCILTSIP
jgi:hypothetical protein